MPRKLRIEYPGAIYHVMNRGDQREDIFKDDEDRRRLLATLGEACEKTQWQVHAYCLMRKHFHLVAETPRRRSGLGDEVAFGSLHPLDDLQIFMNGKQTTQTIAVSLLSALRFAADKHRLQRRKDSEATPYINHPIAVADALARIGGVSDVATLQAAILHDTLEDTQTTAQELDEQFGQEVRLLVQEVTDQKNLPQAERKRLQVEHAPTLSPAAKRIKVADKTCNLKDITSKQPMNWSLQRKRDYLDWAEKVVAGCRGCNESLENHFDAVLNEKRLMLKTLA